MLEICPRFEGYTKRNINDRVIFLCLIKIKPQIFFFMLQNFKTRKEEPSLLFKEVVN